jgi:quercetin dioxygenase-like cupin family protein
MAALRLQGHAATTTEVNWVGLSHFLPGGGAQSSASPLERIYVVVSGQLTVTSDGEEAVLGPLDSVCFAPGEARTLVNHTTLPATMLVLMPYPPAAG